MQLFARKDNTVAGQSDKSQQQMAAFILSAIEDGVVMVGRDNRIRSFNPAAEHITGWSAAEAIGLDFHNVLSIVDEHGSPIVAEEHPFSKALNTGTTTRDNDTWLATKGDKRLPVSLIISPVVQEQGKPPENVVGVIRDITTEKAEEARRSEFISTASHEMRTPLTAIEGYLALALNEKIAHVDDNARKYLTKASDAVKHLGVLFQDLLTSSRAEDGRLASYPVVVEISEMAEQVVEEARFKAKQKGLELRLIMAADKDVAGGKVVRPLYYAYVDPHRMREVVQNLIDNAVKYTMEGSINIKLTGDPAVVQLQVQDTGPGIPSEDIPHLFQKFYRVDSSLTRTVGGTGLGLYICKKIVEMYSGRIWVESDLGHGSTFFINLPRLSAQQALEKQKQQAALVSPLDSPR